MKLLIIEDDIEICQMIKVHLEKFNYEVFYTLSGAEGVSLAKKINPVLIILDLMLPFTSGDKILSEIRTFSDVPTFYQNFINWQPAMESCIQVGFYRK